MSSRTELAPHFSQDASKHAGAAKAVASTQQQTRGLGGCSSGGLGSSVHRAFGQSPLHSPGRKEQLYVTFQGETLSCGVRSSVAYKREAMF